MNNIAGKCFLGSKVQFVLIEQGYFQHIKGSYAPCPSSIILVSLINYMFIVIFNYVMPISGMFLIMCSMHMSLHIHVRQTIKSYCAGMCTNTKRTFQGGEKCIPSFLLMSVDIFDRMQPASRP